MNTGELGLRETPSSPSEWVRDSKDRRRSSEPKPANEKKTHLNNWPERTRHGSNFIYHIQYPVTPEQIISSRSVSSRSVFSLVPVGSKSSRFTDFDFILVAPALTQARVFQIKVRLGPYFCSYRVSELIFSGRSILAARRFEFLESPLIKKQIQ